MLVLFFSSTYGQLHDYVAFWSAQQIRHGTSSLEIVGSDAAGGIFAVKTRINKSSLLETPDVLEYYDSNLNLTKSFDLKIRDQGKKILTEQVVKLNNTLFVFYSQSVDEKISLYAMGLDKSTLQPRVGKRRVFEIPISGKSKVLGRHFIFRFSQDSSKLFVLRNLSQNGHVTDSYSCIMLDSSFHVRWQKKVSLPYKGGQFRIENIKVNNEGNVYVLGIINNMYDLITVRNEGDSIVRYPIRLKGYFLNSVQIEILAKDHLVCGGFYSMTSTQGTSGTYFMSVDFSRHQIKHTYFAPFNARFILEGLGNRDSKWNFDKGERGEAAELYRYTLDNLLIGKDGEVILIGEQRYRYSNTLVDYGLRGSGMPPLSSRVSRTPISFVQPVYLTNTSAMARNYHYVANDILVVRLDSTGRMNWSQRIQKSQNTLDDDGLYSSYLCARIGEKLCFLFNDDPRNLQENSSLYPREYDGTKSIVTMISMDNDGNLMRHSICNTLDNAGFVPKMSKWISGSELILFGRKQFNQQLGKVTFK